MKTCAGITAGISNRFCNEMKQQKLLEMQKMLEKEV